VINRRHFIALTAASAGSMFFPSERSWAQDGILTKPIPSCGEMLPLVGLGSWITFNVGRDQRGLAQSASVMRAFFEAGGRMIDSSPMYGSSQTTIGYGLAQTGVPDNLFATDKVWTSGQSDGVEQIAKTQGYWGVPKFSLIQVHNLRDWKAHLPTLFEMKRQGNLGYVGVTTSHGRRHRELERILTTQPIDFLQLTYNAANREAENRLLPLARERGIAVIANRPFGGGRLIRKVNRTALPSWAQEFECKSWSEFLLKFIVSNPAMNCAIPATTNVQHVLENMSASRGILPNENLRRRMAAHIEAI